MASAPLAAEWVIFKGPTNLKCPPIRSVVYDKKQPAEEVPMTALQNQSVTLDAKGRIVLPRQVRDAAGLNPGAELIASVDESGVIHLEKLSVRIARAQDYFSRYAVPDKSAVDELIADRRHEATRE